MYIYKSHDNNKKEKALISYNIHVYKKDMDLVTEELFKDGATVLYPTQQEVIEIKTRLFSKNLLKTEFTSAVDQRRLVKAMKRTILWTILNSDMFGFKTACNLIKELKFDYDYAIVLMNPYTALVPSFSFNQQNKISYALANLVKEHLVKNTFNEILDQVEHALNIVNPEEDFSEFRKYYLEVKSLDKVYQDFKLN